MRTSYILDVLFPEIRRKILTVVLLQPEKRWYLSELAALLNTRVSSLQREVDALGGAGILALTRDGRRLYVKADTDSAIFPELKSLFEKTVGIVPCLERELEPFGESIRFAFIYGSVAQSREGPGSDIDLMVVGTVGLAALIPMLRRVEKALGRPINPTVFSIEEFRTKALRADHFLGTVLRERKEFVKGDGHELETVLSNG